MGDPHWAVRAESVYGALMTFGLRAPDVDSARKAAREKLPFQEMSLLVTQENADVTQL